MCHRQVKESVMASVYSSTKIFHFRDKIDSLPEHVNEIKAPIHIRIKPTNICNHNCWYCAYKADNLQLGQDMQKRDYIPREKMFAIIEDIADMGVRAVTFTGGGDPLYYPYLTETVKKLSGTRIKFACLTNGSRLQDEAAEIFAHHGTWVRISMDGWDDRSYAAFRGVPEGEFTKVMYNMERFKKLGGDCFLGVSLVVHQDNSSSVHEMLARLKDIGVDSAKISPCIVGNSGAENNEYHRPIFDTVREQIRRACKSLADGTFEILDAYHELDERFDKDYCWCPYVQVLTVIGADLNVYSCQDKAYNLDTGSIGSIKETTFKQLWFSDKKRFFKINPSEHCNHHCVANGKNRLVLDYLRADSDHLDFV
jgi:MoaA/NifB/PqqE/SkfB family radical SAM enzyme